MYHVLAGVYDQMQEVDYNAFADYYEAIFQKFCCKPKLMLDLGCGTGAITLLLAQRGYDMIGLDASPEMLEVAMEKAREAKKDILFLHQDMTEFELYGTVDAMVCALDGVNYLTEDGALEAMLRLLHYYLEPGGLFIFDVNTPYKFETILDGQTYLYDYEDAFCAWTSDYDREEKICCFDLNFFLKNPNGSYRRMDEYQQERAYTAEELKTKIADCGLICEGVYDHLSFDAPREDSERIFVVVRRPYAE